MNAATFTATLDASGLYPYVCTPHRALGTKGAVVVE
jgi:plastocyanin